MKCCHHHQKQAIFLGFSCTVTVALLCPKCSASDFSGAEDKRGYLWDRYYGVHLRCFAHSDVVNSVAFNPHDQEMLVTVSDDNKIKVWRSRRRMRELQDRVTGAVSLPEKMTE